MVDIGGVGGDSYLPPVVAQFVGDAEQFMRTIAEVKAALEDLERTAGEVRVTLEDKGLLAGIGQAQSLLHSLDAEHADPTVDLNIAPALEKLAALKAATLGLSADGAGVAAAAAAGGAGAFLAGAAAWGAGGWMFNVVHTMHLWVPALVGLGSALAITATGFTALAAAAAPTVVALQQGYSAVDQANDAMKLALPGTQSWTTATQQLGSAWASIPSVLQPAVRQIYDAIQGGSGAIGQSAQNWVLGLVNRFTSVLGEGGPLYTSIYNTVRATENAINTYIINPLLGSGGQGKLVKFFNAIARDIGPALNGLTNLAKAVGHLFGVLAGLGIGGQGLNLLTSFVKMISGLLSSPMGHAFLTTMVDIDRYILAIVSDVMRMIGAFKGLGPIVGVLAAVAEVAYSWSKLGGLFTRFVVMPIVGGVKAIITALKSIATASTLGDVFKGAGAAAAGGAAGEGEAAVGGIAGALGLSAGAAAGVVGAALVAAAAAGFGIYELTKGTSPNPYTGMAGMSSGQINALANGTMHAGVLPSGVTAQAAQEVLKLAQAEGISAQAAAKNQAQQWNLAHATDAVAKATKSSTATAQYALQVTHGNTAAAAAYVRAQDQIGSRLASLATGFATFTVGAKTSVSSMFSNLRSQNTTLVGWANDAQTLIKRGMNPAAVADLVETVPQDLGELVNLSGPKLKQLSNLYMENSMINALLVQQGTQKQKQNLLNGLAALDPVAAQQMQKLVHTMYGYELQLGSQGHNAGYLWGQGLANALKASMPAVSNAAQQLADTVATVTKLQHLTASPSRLAYYFGQMWGEGLALGISSSKSQAANASASLALAVAGAGFPGTSRLTPSLAGGYHPAGLAGGQIANHVNVQVTVPPGTTNPQAIGDAVGKAVDAKLTQVVQRLTAGSVR